MRGFLPDRADLASDKTHPERPRRSSRQDVTPLRAQYSAAKLRCMPLEGTIRQHSDAARSN
jgi:hypothetical protein